MNPVRLAATISISGYPDLMLAYCEAGKTWLTWAYAFGICTFESSITGVMADNDAMIFLDALPHAPTRHAELANAFKRLGICISPQPLPVLDQSCRTVVCKSDP